MEQVRNIRLDNICEGINDERGVMNAAKQQEQSLISSALQVMQQSGITVYKHGGVELVRVPGVDKLRVRLSKEDGDAEVQTGTMRSTNNDGSDDGEDAGLEAGRPEPEFDDERDELTH